MPSRIYGGIVGFPWPLKNCLSNCPYADPFLADDDAKAPAAKHLAKWRPHVLETKQQSGASLITDGTTKLEEVKEAPFVAAPLEVTTGSEQMNGTPENMPVVAAG